MPSKPPEFVRGDPVLLQAVQEQERPEFIIEDATGRMELPPVTSPEAKIFIAAAEDAIERLNQGREQGGHNGAQEQ